MWFLMPFLSFSPSFENQGSLWFTGRIWSAGREVRTYANNLFPQYGSAVQTNCMTRRHGGAEVFFFFFSFLSHLPLYPRHYFQVLIKRRSFNLVLFRLASLATMTRLLNPTSSLNQFDSSMVSSYEPEYPGLVLSPRF